MSAVWVSSPAGQNRRTVGHCGRTKLLLHAHRFDTLGDPIKLNANAKKTHKRGIGQIESNYLLKVAVMRALRPNESHSRSSKKVETQEHSASSGMRKRHSS